MMHLLSRLLLLVLVAALPVTFLVDRKANKHRRRRLHELLADQAEPASPTLVKEPVGLQRLISRPVTRSLRQLGLELKSRDIALGAALVLALFGAIAATAGMLAAIGAVALFCLSAWVVMRYLASRRVTRFAGQLPGFLDRLRQLISIGNTVPTAFARAVGGSQPIVREFLEPAVRRVHNGAGFSDSIRQSADDIDLHEFRLFATTVTANTRFGGSLSHTLSNLATYLRKRAAIERELRASTAQVRVSAWVLASLPVVVAGAIMLQNRDYANWFLTHSAGKEMLLYCLVSQAMGAIAMRLIVRTSF